MGGGRATAKVAVRAGVVAAGAATPGSSAGIAGGFAGWVGIDGRIAIAKSEQSVEGETGGQRLEGRSLCRGFRTETAYLSRLRSGWQSYDMIYYCSSEISRLAVGLS